MEGLPGRLHPLKGDRSHQLALDLWGPYRLIFEPETDDSQLRSDGTVDAKKVKTIIIKEVVDYHGD
jgi:proteic killer suppression protein